MIVCDWNGQQIKTPRDLLIQGWHEYDLSNTFISGILGSQPQLVPIFSARHVRKRQPLVQRCLSLGTPKDPTSQWKWKAQGPKTSEDWLVWFVLFFFFFGAGSLRVGTATQDETDETTRIEEMLKDETLRSCKMLGGMDNCVQSNRFFWSFPILSGVWSWNLSIPGFDNWFSVALELPDIR